MYILHIFIATFYVIMIYFYANNPVVFTKFMTVNCLSGCIAGF